MQLKNQLNKNHGIDDDIKALSCAQVQDELSAYIDGELPLILFTAIEHHLDGCDSCRAELDGLLGLSFAMQQAGDLPLPANFQAELHQKLLAVEASPSTTLEGEVLPEQPVLISPPKKLWQKSWFPRAVAACIVLGVGLTVGNIFYQDRLLNEENQGLMVASEPFSKAKESSPADLPPTTISPLDTASLNQDTPGEGGAVSNEDSKPQSSPVPTAAPSAVNKVDASADNEPMPMQMSVEDLPKTNASADAKLMDIMPDVSVLEDKVLNSKNSAYIKISAKDQLVAKNQFITLVGYFDGKIITNEDGMAGSLQTGQNPYLCLSLSKDNLNKLLSKVETELIVAKTVIVSDGTDAEVEIKLIVEFVK